MFAIILILTLLPGSSQSSAGRYGHVDFANSGSLSAQADFLDGLALLHDFEYEAAAAAFQRAEAADSSFAIAYWGEAMTFNYPIWMQQDLRAARAALSKLAPTSAERRAKAKTDREKGYLDAVEALYGDGSKEERDFLYEAAMAKLHARYPDDVDATAFYGLAILGTAHGGRDTTTYIRAAGLLEDAWVNHHEHPGLLHYLIHCYDDPSHAPLGLRAARLYAIIAPDAGHAQHMTSHIFLALGMWPETVGANIAAIADVDRVRKSQGKGPAGCGHYPSWLEYAYLQLGQMDKAARTLGLCRQAFESQSAMESPGHSMDSDASLTAAFANMRLRYLLDSGDWAGEAARATPPQNASAGARLDFLFAQVMSEIMQRQEGAARKSVSELEAVGREATEIETKRGDLDPTYRVRPQIFLLEARGLLAEQDGHLAESETFLRQAVGLEEKLPIAFGPPTIDKPTHELLGEFLLRHGRKAEAHAEFEKALAGTPGRRLAQQGFQATVQIKGT